MKSSIKEGSGMLAAGVKNLASLNLLQFDRKSPSWGGIPKRRDSTLYGKVRPHNMRA